MGYDVTRFKGTINDWFKCSICSNVLQCPVQRPSCEHIFCSKCITGWLQENRTCPLDKGDLEESDLKKAPRLLVLLMADLEINCDYASSGCVKYMRLDALESHLKVCSFDPNLRVVCELGCGVIVGKNEGNHNCVAALKAQVKSREILKNQIIEETKAVKEQLKVKDEIIQALHKEVGLIRQEILRLKTNRPEASPLEPTKRCEPIGTKPSDCLPQPQPVIQSPPGLRLQPQDQPPPLASTPFAAKSRLVAEKARAVWLHSRADGGWTGEQSVSHQPVDRVKKTEPWEERPELEANGKNVKKWEEGDGPDVTTIKVSNLPVETTKEDIEALFKHFGRILYIHLKRDDYGHGAFSYVKFETKEDATKALDRVKGQKFHNIILTVEWAKHNLSMRAKKWGVKPSIATK